MADRAEIDRIREVTNLVELIGSHVALEPRGREHVGLCPFHDDNSPSMAVVTHKGQAFFKCHACGASGDAFSFMMKYLRIDFPEALQQLAQRAGITLSGLHVDPADSARRSMRERIRQANDSASRFFRETLSHETQGQAARRMLQERGISEEMAESFMIGCAPEGWDGYLQALGGKSELIESAHAAGLLRERDSKSGSSAARGHYDTFRHRLIFPICNESGQPIAFGGRVLDEDDEPKYLNSPESDVFQKGRTLYGLHLARRSIMEQDCVLIAEGYTDIIACHQAGFCNVIGTLGTALTDDHARVLSRICNTVILLFDGDEAGQRAADRALEVFLHHPVDIRVCILPEGMDPAELLQQTNGADRFRGSIETSQDVLAYVLQRFQKSLQEVDGMSGRQKVLEGFMGELGRLGLSTVQGIRRSLLLNKLADLMRLPLTDIESLLSGARSQRPRPASAVDATASSAMLLGDPGDPALTRGRRLAEREYLSLLLYDPTVWQRDSEPLLSLDCFLDDRARALAGELLPRLAEGEHPTIQDLHRDFTDESLGELASHLWFMGQRMATDPQDEYETRTPFQQISQALRSSMEHARTEQRLADFSTAPDDPAAVTELIEHLRECGPRVTAIHRETRN